jgi:anti-sigma regulatory factor (Ser/Thr protein kinase)
MSIAETRRVRPLGPAFRHEALLYADHREFLAGTVPFIHDGLARDEPTLVVVDSAKIAAIRDELGDDADRVYFADMSTVGRNPARIIPRWRQFIDDHLRPDRPVRGIGEPIWAGRGPAELIECQAHETLLNVAFADSAAWTLLCPYDLEALEPDVVAEARRSHPYVVIDGSRQLSGDYLDEHPSPARLNHPLPPPPADAYEIRFGPGPEALRTARRLVEQHAAHTGLDPASAGPLTLTVSELVTNSLCHGGGHGTLRLWRDGDTLVCEVSDAGQISGPPLLGRQHPPPDQLGGRGLWLANQLCDLVQIRCTETGTTVRVHMTVT